MFLWGIDGPFILILYLKYKYIHVFSYFSDSMLKSTTFISKMLALLREILSKATHISSSIEHKYFWSFLVIFFLGVINFPNKGSFVNSNQGEDYVDNYAKIGLYSEEELEYLNNSITQVLIDSGFNGNVMIARYGMMIYERSFGMASFSNSVPLNMETSFQLASISKTFTATAILLLQEQGLLDVSDKVITHIPEFPYENITIQHLLSHTSGLQNYMWLVERRWNKKKLPDNEDILTLFIESRRPLNFSPGQRFDYSNTGFIFLGLLIERLSGQSYATFVKENIFEPLEMERSFVNDLHNPVDIENRAYGYRQWRGSHIRIPDDNLDGPLGDKGVFSSAGDLFKWDQAIYRNALLPFERWEQAFTHARLNNDSLANYGFGWRLQEYLDKRIVHHPGRWHGFRTSFKRFPQDHTTLIILANNNQNIAGIIEKIQDIIYYDEKEIWVTKNKEKSLQEPEDDDISRGNY